MPPCRMRASSATPPDTGRLSGAVASAGRVLPGLAYASAIRRRGRPPPRAWPPAFPRERDRRPPAPPARTPCPRTFPRERDRRPPAPPARTRCPRTFPRERDRRPPAPPARTRCPPDAIAARPRLRPGRHAPGRSRGNAVTVCPQLGPGRRAPGRSRGNVPRLRQRLRVNVQHHLIPVAGRPPVEAARQRRLRHRPDGVRLPLRQRWRFCLGRGTDRPGGRFVFRAGRRVGGFLLRARRRVGGFLFPAAVRRRRAPRLVASRLQRPPQHRPHLRRQPPADDHHPVLVHPRPQLAARLLPPFLRLLHVPVDAPPRPGDPLHVRRRARERHVEQGLLVLRGGHPRDRAHLRVGDLAAAHGVAQLGQLPEGAGHPHVLAGGPQREPGPPAQPLRAREATVPALPLVELVDEDEQLVGGGLDASRQLGDAVAEPRELRSALAGRSRRPARRRLVGGLDIGPVVAASVGSRGTLAGSRRGVGGRRSVGRWQMRGGRRRRGAVFRGHEPL